MAHVPGLQGPCPIAFLSCTDSSPIWKRSGQLSTFFINHKFEVCKLLSVLTLAHRLGFLPLFPGQLDWWPRPHELRRKEASTSCPKITTISPFSFVNIAQDERTLGRNTTEISPFQRAFFTIVNRLPQICLFDRCLNIRKNSVGGQSSSLSITFPSSERGALASEIIKSWTRIPSEFAPKLYSGCTLLSSYAFPSPC